jgi:2'-5' RNA ligase
MSGAPEADRLFLGVAMPEPVREALRAHLHLVGELPGRVVPPESWHLTLRFLGDTPPEQRERLAAELASAPLGPSLEIAFGGLGAFPHPARARVLWLGVEEGREPLRALAHAAEQVARRAGFAAERRPFAPHLTLSRLRSPTELGPLIARLPPASQPMRVDEVVLFRSVLGAGPARYQALRRVPLG